MGRCPKCKKQYDGYPALSRVDNKTKICSLCGIAEAIAIANEIIENKRYDLRIDSLSPEERAIIRMLKDDE